MARSSARYYGFLALGGTRHVELAGLLVTDTLGLPAEFVHTEPFAPTKLQRALLGEAARRFLKQRGVVSTLVDQAEKRPSLVVVDDDELLELLPTGLAGAYVMPSTGPSRSAAGAGDGAPDADVVLRGPGGRAIRARTHGDAAHDLLAGAAGELDLTEPLARVRAALSIVADDNRAA